MATPKVVIDEEEQMASDFLKQVIKPADEKRLSPLLDKDEKQQVWNLGQSLDSKKVTSALGYLDLKQICYCLAQALQKHIQFSKGHFFLDEIKSSTGEGVDQMEFSYNLGKDMKIDLDAAKQKRDEKKQKQEQSKKEFEELKKQMEQNKNAVPSKTPKNPTNNKGRLIDQEREDDGVAERSDDGYSDIEDETH